MYAGCAHLKGVGKAKFHDVKRVAMFLEHWFDGVLHRTFWRNLHDLGHLVGEVHLKDISLVGLEDVEMLCVCLCLSVGANGQWRLNVSMWTGS